MLRSMPRPLSARLLALLTGILVTGFTAAAAESWPSDPVRGAAELERQWAEIAAPRPTTGIRGIFRFALEAAGLHWHPERITAALALATSMQDHDPASRTYGNFRWRFDQSGVLDPNAVEFSLQQAALLALHSGDALDDAGRRTLGALLDFGLQGIDRHPVPTSYTNIFLMQAWNRIGAGEALRRADVAAAGYRQLDEWLRFTAVNGISEYGAVTYYGVDLDSLGLIARYAAQPAGRSAADLALRYFWTDIAANWWEAGDRLASANSRSYDTLFGRGYLEAHTWTAGWLRARPELENAGWLSGPHDQLATFLAAASWSPPPDVTEAIRAHVPRVVVQRWNGAPLQRRATAYIGRHVSLASSGITRGADERTLVADLGDSPAIPQVVLFMDGRGDPYGLIKTENAAHQAKALHLEPFIATVQRGPELIQVLSFDPGALHAHAGSLSVLQTQLTIPAAAEVWAEDQRIEPGTPARPATIAAGRPIFLRIGDAAIGVRFLLAVAATGLPAPIYFIADRPDTPARRLTVVHSPARPTGRGTTVVWMRVADGLNDARFAEFRRDFGRAKGSARLRGGDLTVEVAGNGAPLRIRANLLKEDRQELAGQEPDGLLAINGEDVGRELLADFGAR
jgi:hypothetical protein